MRTLIVALAVAGCSYDAPINTNELSAAPLTNTIAGTVVYPGEGDPGPTFITVYAANNPGPPSGTGGPVTFASVPAYQFARQPDGIRSAEFAVTGLPDGQYLVNALMDRDVNFNPFATGLAGATCGDWVGTHPVNLTETTSAVVTVKGGELKSGITVALGVEIPVERPAFQLVGTPTISRQTAAESILPDGSPDPTKTQRYRLQSTRVSTAFGEESPLELPGPCKRDDLVSEEACGADAACFCETDPLEPCDTAFWVYLVDDDGDGEVDPYPSELQAAGGIKNVWPRIYIELQSDELGTFKHEGQILPERWVGENYPLAFEIAIETIFGGPVVSWPLGQPFPAQEMSVTFSPAFRHYHKDGSYDVDANGPFDLVDLRDPAVDPNTIPQGAWGVTVISYTGQTWALPNEIGLGDLPTFHNSFDVAKQAGTLTVE